MRRKVQGSPLQSDKRLECGARREFQGAIEGSASIEKGLEAVRERSKAPSCHSERSEESHQPRYMRIRDSSAHASE